MRVTVKRILFILGICGGVIGFVSLVHLYDEWVLGALCVGAAYAAWKVACTIYPDESGR